MSDQPADDQNDLMVQQAIQNDGRSLTAFDDGQGEQPEPTPAPDPVNRNLAMQLALQKNPNISIDELKLAADSFYSYLTQRS